MNIEIEVIKQVDINTDFLAANLYTEFKDTLNDYIGTNNYKENIDYFDLEKITNETLKILKNKILNEEK